MVITKKRRARTHEEDHSDDACDGTKVQHRVHHEQRVFPVMGKTGGGGSISLRDCFVWRLSCPVYPSFCGVQARRKTNRFKGDRLTAALVFQLWRGKRVMQLIDDGAVLDGAAPQPRLGHIPLLEHTARRTCRQRERQNVRVKPVPFDGVAELIRAECVQWRCPAPERFAKTVATSADTR